MKLNMNEVQAIVDTLPIGIYTERRIAVTLVKGNMSTYDPEKDCIEISFNQITNGLDAYKGDPETLIRSNFYHEVSHAILTPKSLNANDITNIFEDERIETILNGYYYGTNFKETVYAINGLKPGDPLPPLTKPIQRFYALVRFRVCPDKSLLKRVDEIIEKYEHLNRASGRWDDRGSAEYEYDIRKLAQDCGIRFPKGSEGGLEMPILTEMGEGESPQEKDGMENPDGENSTDIPTHGIAKGDKLKRVQQLLSNGIDKEFNADFHNSLEILFDQFRKKNSGGSAINAYSGIINPRAVSRTDYRYFERPQSNRGNNCFGTFHLNLFIDVSGSFQDNTNVTNQIIKSLILLEKRHKNFTFDIVTMSTYIVERPKEKRFIKCEGGNYLSKKIETVFKKLQLKNTYNYNIVLFDGDAYSDFSPSHGEEKYSRDGEGFKTFNNNNTTIISDRDNRRYINKFAPNTRTIYTKNYTDELLQNILKIMSKALN